MIHAVPLDGIDVRDCDISQAAYQRPLWLAKCHRHVPPPEPRFECRFMLVGIFESACPRFQKLSVLFRFDYKSAATKAPPKLQHDHSLHILEARNSMKTTPLYLVLSAGLLITTTTARPVPTLRQTYLDPLPACNWDPTYTFATSWSWLIGLCDDVHLVD